MGFKYQCDINKQNCPTLFPQGLNKSYVYGTATVFFTNQSCVRDKRLEGNVGRCGFPGAPCVINETASNCASGQAEVCIKGTCQGAPGFTCYSDVFCNWGVRCNTTLEEGGTCGGYSAYMANDEVADGLDFGRDYCASGIAVQDNRGYWTCSSGPLAFVSNATYAPSGLTPTTSSVPIVHTASQLTGAIVGGMIGFVLFLLLLSVFWRKREGWHATGGRRDKASGKEIDGLMSGPRSPPKQSGSPVLEVAMETQRTAASISWEPEWLYELTQSSPDKANLQVPLNAQRVAGSISSDREPPEYAIPEVPPDSLPSQSTSLSLGVQSKRGWISRILVFLALETAYLLLVVMAYFQPFPLPRVSLAYSTEAMGVTTILTITWQTLAILPIRDIVSTTFSSEWSHLFWRTGELTPGTTDRVSIQTAGILDRLQHFCTTNASLAFRLALLTSLLAEALVGIAPGALTVKTVFFPSAVRAEVGSIDITKMGTYSGQDTQRAALLTRLEQVEHGEYGFRISEPGVFVGWPQQSTLTSTVGNLTYPSDIVRFNYECRWTAPMLLGVTSARSVVRNGLWAVDGKTSEEEVWIVHGDPSPAHASTGIFPLKQTRGDGAVMRTSSSGTSAWLFIGSNSSYPPVDASSYLLDIGNVSASYNDTFHWTVTEPFSGQPLDDVRDSGAPLASVLLCDPKMSLSTTYVTFVMENNMLLISNMTLSSHIGNISPASAALVLAKSLLDATTIDPLSNPAYSLTSASIFLQQPVGSYKLNQTEYVRSASNISSTIGRYVVSASKAWSDGFYAPKKFSSISVDAVKGEPKLAFVASGLVTITVGILAIIILGFITAELWIPVGQPLGIASLKDALK